MKKAETKLEKITAYVSLIISEICCWISAHSTARVFTKRPVLPGFILFLAGTFCILFQGWTRLELEKYPFWYSAAVYISGAYIGYLLYHLSSLLVLNIVYFLLHFIFRIPVSHYPFAVLAFIIGLTVCVYGLIRAQLLTVVHYTVKSKKMSGRPCRIVQLSDLHIGSVIGPRTIRRIVRITNSLHPDLIVITGDLVNKKSTAECRGIEKTAAELAELNAKDGVFACTGNHDPGPDNTAFRDFLRMAHIQKIDETLTETPSVWLAGRSGNEKEIKTRKPLSEILTPVSSDRPVVVLDHSPSRAEDAVRCGADLILCGHTHAGQFFPCTWFTKKYYGADRNHGMSRVRDTTLIVSAGTGFFQAPFRVGTRSEICCIDLKAE